MSDRLLTTIVILTQVWLVFWAFFGSDRLRFHWPYLPEKTARTIAHTLMVAGAVFEILLVIRT